MQPPETAFGTMNDSRRRLNNLSALTTLFDSTLMSGDETESSEDTPSCRECGSSNLLRSRTRWFEQWLKPLRSTRPYRCRVCEWRGWL